MKKKSQILGIYLLIYTVLAIAAVTLKTIGVFYNLDNYGYYGNAVTIKIANILVIAGSLFLLSYAVVEKKDLKLVPSFSSPMNYIPSGLVSASLVFVAVRLLTTRANGEFKETLLALAGGITAAISILYFLFATVYDKRISAKRRNYYMTAGTNNRDKYSICEITGERHPAITHHIK